MDIIGYALSKKIAEHAVSGVQSMSVEGQNLIINTKDSGVLTMTFPTPKDGVSVTDIDVNANNQIVFTMSDGNEFISGKIPTVKGEPGFSPTIIENADNTDKIYKLDITTADSTFTTPNLKGADGQGGTGGGEANIIDSISVNGVNITPDENKNVDIKVPSIEGLTKDADLAIVAKSGSYNDLNDKPSIPTVTDEYNAESSEAASGKAINQAMSTLKGLPKPYFVFVDDDGKENFKTLYTDILQPRGIVGGLSIVFSSYTIDANKYLTQNEINEYSDLGWDILCHSTDLNSLTIDTADAVLNYCDNRIAYYGFKKSNIFVYPNGNEGDSKIAIEEKVAKHFKYAFNINYSHNCPVNIPLQNRMDIGRIIIPRASEITAEMKAYYKNLIDKTINENKLMIIGTHSDKSDYTYLTELLDYILNQGYSFTSPVKALSEIDEYRFQNKLIPGDNISITPDNIISASFTESDPTVPSHVKSITAKNISDWNNKSDFSGSYNDLVDTPAIPSIEGLAKTEDIPTTLPANGGNSDTVNNHTIESDVPTDAVFTDTIYDDTEVKESIEELSSNLDTLEYSEIAGGKNLANINDFKLLTTNPSRYGYEWINMKGGTYTFNITNGNNILYIGYKHNGEFVNPSSVMNNSKVQIITISDGDDIVIWYENGVTENTVTSLQLEVGGVATEYEPYIPSIKMLNKSLNNYALKSLYSDTTINIGRLANSTVGKYSIAEGQNTTASGDSSHAEGSRTTASGNFSHAEGDRTTASNDYSHAEGFSTIASGYASHAEGESTTASGDFSHAEGSMTTAEGIYSHAEGNNTIANGESQHVQGKYNIADKTSAFIIGNGSSDNARSNAAKIDWNGNLEVAGNLKDGSGNTLNNMMSKTNPTGTGSFSLNRKANTTIGDNSFAEGDNTTASGYFSHAEGDSTTASEYASHAEGDSTTASGYASHAEGEMTTASGHASHAEGWEITASGANSHAEGNNTTASGDYSHAEGKSTTASASYTHSEGVNTSAIGQGSHAEGSNLEKNRYNEIVFENPRKVEIYDGATGDFINITVAGSQAFGLNSHAEGCSTLAYGKNSHTEGYHSVAQANESHAEGCGSEALEMFSHAEGYETKAKGSASHTEGYITTASGSYSHAEGYITTASNLASHVSGKYNAAMTTGGASGNTTGTAFVIGNGTGTSALSNAFSVQFNGIVKAKSTITASTTADYAEFFEWLDKNPNEEDRVGHFVTLDGDKIKIATSEDDYILGIVSGEPFVLGNGDCDTWNGMYLHDEFRRTIYEPAPKMIEILDSEGNPTGEYEEVEGEYEGTRPVLNPNYDQTKQYISRFDRAEWSPVGMLGVLAVLHDGTAEVNGYVTVNNEGIATKCTRDTRNSYRVIKKVSDKVVEVIFR